MTSTTDEKVPVAKEKPKIKVKRPKISLSQPLPFASRVDAAITLRPYATPKYIALSPRPKEPTERGWWEKAPALPVKKKTES